jgi:hypothetical protein
VLVAADFFTVEVWTRNGLQRFMLLFFIELSTHKVEIAGITSVAKSATASHRKRTICVPCTVGDHAGWPVRSEPTRTRRFADPDYRQARARAFRGHDAAGANESRRSEIDVRLL